MSEEYEVRAIPYYTNRHTWARVTAEGSIKIGVTDYAQKMLREIVYVDLPDVGDTVKCMEPFGLLESVKSVSELYAPLTGKVKQMNKDVINDPSLINRDPYEAGWLLIIEPTKLEEEFDKLIDADAYKKLIRDLTR